MFCHLLSRALLLWLVFANLLNQSAAGAEIKPGARADKAYRFKQWTVQDGLPQNTIKSLVQTRDGYLWICTGAGLARFDGVRFTVFNRSNTPEMTSDSCVTMTEDIDGGLWIGTEDGLLCWKNHRFTAYPAGRGGLSHKNIRTVRAARDGGVWIGTEDGLDHLHQGTFTHYTTKDGLQANNIRAVIEDAKGTVWVGTEIEREKGGLQRMERGAGKFVSMENYGTSVPFMVNFIAGDKSGTVWWGNNQGLHRMDAHGLKDFGLADGLSGSVVKWIDPGPGGNLMVVTGERGEGYGRRGLHSFRNGTISRIELADFGIEDDVICALEDFEGNIWVGTRTDGLVMLRLRTFDGFTARDGMNASVALSICEASDRTIYVGTKRGLNSIRDGKVEDHRTKIEWLDNSPIQSVISIGDGGIWTGSAGYQWLRQFGPGGWSGVPQPRAMPYYGGTLYRDRDGFLWAAHEKDVTSINIAEPQLEFLLTLTNISQHGVRAILRDRAGAMWFGTHGDGVIRVIQEQRTVFTTRDGLSSNRAWALHEDAEGVLWVGTDHGLNRFKDGRIRAFTTKDGLFDDRVHCVLEDDAGSFWISSLHGVYKVRRQELNNVADGKANLVHCVPYGEADGMPSSETSGGYQPAGWKASDGRLWFPTVKGVAVVDPKSIQDNTNLPPIVIEQVIADGKIIYGDGVAAPVKARADLREQGWSPAPSQAQLRLGPGRARLLEIRYTANSFAAPEKVRFKYWLEGHDKRWVDADSKERVARFTNLRPGGYRFHVKACNNHGYWNETGDSFGFSLAPTFTQTVWFPILLVLGGVGFSVALGTWRLRWQRRLLKLEEQRALANERTRIARDLHDDLGTALTGLALKLDVAGREATVIEKNTRDPRTGVSIPPLPQPSPPSDGREGEEAAGSLSARLDETARHTRSLAERMREVVWTVNPRCDNLPSLAAFLEQQMDILIRASGVQARLEFPENIPVIPLKTEARHQLALGVREALTNVVRHAQATEVVMSLTIADGMLVVRVADNGLGFQPDQIKGAGQGLSNMRTRMEDVGGTFKCDSSPSHGTTVIFQLSVSSSENNKLLP